METPEKEESFFYISGNRNPRKIPYVSGNVTFASFLRKSVICDKPFSFTVSHTDILISKHLLSSPL